MIAVTHAGEQMRLKVTHIITGLSRGGAENALYRLIAAQPEPARHPVISLTDDGIFGERLRSLGVTVRSLGLRRGSIPSPIAVLKLARWLRQLRPDIVQTWMYHSDLLGGLAARCAGIPVCWGIHHTNLSAQHSRRSTRLTVDLCAWLSSQVPARAISCSTRAAEVHLALGYKVPFEIVHNGLDASTWRPEPSLRGTVRGELGMAEHNFVFAHAGRDDPQKDHFNLALAFSHVHTAMPHARLILCGQGLAAEDGWFRSLPFSSSAQKAILALGARDDLPRLWQAADALVLSSSFGEALPTVVSEAMACGLPCVVTDVGDAAEMVGDTGFVVPPSDPAALAGAMLELGRLSRAEYTRRGVAARQRALDRFTLDRMSAGFHRVWSDILSKSRQRCAA